MQHPFVKAAAIELQANRGASEVMKRMVDRLMIRRQELAKKKENQKLENGADFGNTLVTSKARDSDIDGNTIIQWD